MPSANTIDDVDARGPRFSAWLTSAVLIVALLVAGFSATAAAILLAAQTAVFAVGALGGPRAHPYGRLFAALAAPRLGPVTQREPVPPLRFAQLLGFVFAATGTAGFVLGQFGLGAAATAAALFAAFLNAAFDVCLGCRLYPFAARLRRAPVRPHATTG
ncbi:DUF4395 domain-containing protein [Mycolicibacterium palauense]|uniref:DUF4395 domain-containing protein n=1 Tax=Mycolicibacterium palauense TaxID=2034511 RepID=UPI000BFED1EF|nr:DUF4395 domain-containing protein [Mycolicibacterium palauense]